MDGDASNDGRSSELGEVGEAVRAELDEFFAGDVNVKVYRHHDRLDVHVEPVGLKQTIEDAHPELTVAPYRNFKLTVSRSK